MKLFEVGRRFLAALLALTGIGITITVNIAVEFSARSPVPIEQLGLAVDHAAESAMVARSLPPFQVVGATQFDAAQNQKRDVRLWIPARRANGGKHLPNYPQETGDCVSLGAANDAQYYIAAGIGSGALPDAEYHGVFPPHIYGGSRVTIGGGRLGRSAGSVGAWAAEWVQEYGILPSDLPGVPKYSGSLADNWGARGVPKEWIKASEPFKFKTVAQIRTAEDGCDAINNGYPFTIASNFGTRSINVKDGRRVALWNASWPHQMCVIGYDGDEPSGERYFYVINSWGENAHPAPLQDEPPGGFWVTWKDLNKIVSQGDSWAFSGFDGFPARDEFVPDFSVVGAAAPLESSGGGAMFTVREDLLLPGNLLGVLLVALSVWVWVSGRLGKFAFRTGLCVALLAACSVATVRGDEPDFSLLARSAQPAEVDWSQLARSAQHQETEDLFKTLAVTASGATEVCPPGACKTGAVVYVYADVYAPDWCGWCKQMEGQIGTGDKQLPVRFIHGSDASFPAWVQAVGQYPLIHLVDKQHDQFWQGWGAKSLPELKAWAERRLGRKLE